MCYCSQLFSWSWQLAVPCYIQSLCLKLMNLWCATLREVSTSGVAQGQHPPAEPRWPRGLSGQYSDTWHTSCNGNILSPIYEIIDRNLGKSLSLQAAKSTYKALTQCIRVAQCLNRLCWQPATTAGRGVTFLSSEQFWKPVINQRQLC